VTKYSPLYIAAYNGKKDIVEILLKKFPELINVQTVEKWLPLHAACFNGHSQVLEFLLKYRSGRMSNVTLKFRETTPLNFYALGNHRYHTKRNIP
jgi:ankyrin repeat protein